MKKILLLIVFNFWLNTIFAQTPQNVDYTLNGWTNMVTAGTPGSIDSWYSNLQRYWYYRYRLVNDFMKIGTNAGESLPASCRDRWDDNKEWGDLYGVYGAHIPNCQNMLDWGTDATNSLGHYLSTLAIEYRQLRDHGLSTAETLREIDSVMNAFQRLSDNSYYYEWEALHDSYDSASYPGNKTTAICSLCPAPSSGFFLRDDVPFLTITDPVRNPNNYKHFNRPGITTVGDSFMVNKASGAFRTSYHGPNLGSIAQPNINSSSYYHGVEYDASSIGYPSAESQDQLNEIFIGYGLLCNYLDGPEPEIPGLRLRAWQTMYQIIHWPSEYNGPHDDLPCPLVCYGSWYTPPDILNHSDCAGGNCAMSGVYAFSALGATDACYKILHSTGAGTYAGGVLTDAAWHDFTTTNRTVFINLFEMMQEPRLDPGCLIPATIDMYDDSYVCFGNDWTQAISLANVVNLLVLIGTALAFALIGYSTVALAMTIDHYDEYLALALAIPFFILTGAEMIVNKELFEARAGASTQSWGAIRARALSDYFGMPQYPLLYQLIQGPRGYENDWYIKNMLDNAPCCGPWNNENAANPTPTLYSSPVTLPGGYVLPVWSGNDLVADPAHRRGIACYDNTPDYASEFNGLDYMELFNLYSYQHELANETNPSLYPEYLQGMINPYYCENYNVNYPDNINYGSKQNKLSLNWLQYLSAVDQIDGTCGWVQFRGGQAIDLLPQDPSAGHGFDAEYGSYFDATIQDYKCHGAVCNDQAYNFASVIQDPGAPGCSGSGHRHRPTAENGETNNKDTSLYHKNVPVEYFPYGKGIKNHPKVDYPETTKMSTFDSLMSIPGNREKAITGLKYVFINGFRKDTAFIDLLSKRYGWNNDTIAKYTIVMPEDELDVDIMPNPTSGNATLTYQISTNSIVHIDFTNTLGQKMENVLDPLDENQSAGVHKIQIHSENLTPGLYIATIQIGNKSISKKLVKI